MAIPQTPLRLQVGRDGPDIRARETILRNFQRPHPQTYHDRCMGATPQPALPGPGSAAVQELGLHARPCVQVL